MVICYAEVISVDSLKELVLHIDQPRLDQVSNSEVLAGRTLACTYDNANMLADMTSSTLQQLQAPVRQCG